MTIEVGERIPEVILKYRDDEGPKEQPLGEKLAGRKVVIFGLPGAFTGTCSTSHLPSFIRTADAIRAKGVDEIICIAVNDTWVMQEWGRATGADKAGITMLADPESVYSKAVGLTFSNPAAGMYDRTTRHTLLAEDGVVKILNLEEDHGVCSFTAGETLLDQL